MGTDTRNEKVELGGCVITQSFLLLSSFLLSSIQLAQWSHSNMLSNGFVFTCEIPHLRPDCAHSAEQENNIHLLAQILGDRSCSRATKNELLLSQVWTFALKPAFDETFLWISTLLFIAGQSAHLLWLCPFYSFFALVSFWSMWWSHIFLLSFLHQPCFQSQRIQVMISNLQLLQKDGCSDIISPFCYFFTCNTVAAPAVWMLLYSLSFSISFLLIYKTWKTVSYPV